MGAWEDIVEIFQVNWAGNTSEYVSYEFPPYGGLLIAKGAISDIVPWGAGWSLLYALHPGKISRDKANIVVLFDRVDQAKQLLEVVQELMDSSFDEVPLVKLMKHHSARQVLLTLRESNASVIKKLDKFSPGWVDRAEFRISQGEIHGNNESDN